MTGAADLWRPLRTPIFRRLLIADVISDVGTFMQSVGSAWLMVSSGARRLILCTEAWMLCVAMALAVTMIGGLMSPWLLLALTFARSAGDAVESPAWRAVLPELVRKEELPAASALNGIEFNIARAVGPALAGALIAAAGVGAAFLVNERLRRRDGASRWGLYRDLEKADVYLETFIVTSWAEHLRQHERLTRGDSDLAQSIAAHIRGEPLVRHLIHTKLER
jgi:MFS family permease